MGAGAAGSYIGAFLTREGEDVTLIDQWPEHVEVMKSRGSGPVAARETSPCR